MPLIHGGEHRCQAVWSGPEQECSSQEHNHRRGALNWQVLFWTARTKLALVSKPANRSCIASPGVCSCWRCLLWPVNVQGRWRKFRYLYAPVPNVLTLLTIRRDEDGNPSVLGEPDRLRGQQTHRARPWRPPQCSLARSPPAQDGALGAPRPGPHSPLAGRRPGAPAAGGQLGLQEAAELGCARRGGCVHT